MSATRGLARLDACGDTADLVVRFLNTVDVQDGTDAIATVDGWEPWLSAQGLAGCFGAQDVGARARADELRGDLLALPAGQQHAQGRQVDIRVSVTAHGQVELSAPTATGFLASAAATLAVQERNDRVKICPAGDCRWAFYDTSRNRSRQLCSMSSCGNRAKARAYRQGSTPG